MREYWLDPPKLEPAVECDCCGDTLYWGNTWFEVGHDYVLCPLCYESKRTWARVPMVCSECGKQIEEDDPIVLVKGDAYCDECVREVGEC